jgi:hypothetical protein
MELAECKINNIGPEQQRKSAVDEGPETTEGCDA